ncbi:MAG: nitrogenase cofactor biosynthesis protein NifB [Euryarchaeota archaeon]|nr:nitrogenase cofactor biosynthesis protein NifB [Euryarchaeota archaeon]
MAEDFPAELRAMLDSHPCYTETAHKKCARMHLPVAPKCNIQCNYCNRRYDCMNESRPGVTSEILTPEQAVQKVRRVREKISYLTVLGIAGPGDPLANEATFRTLDLVRNEFPDMTLCLSTNGLLLPKNVERLRSLGVRFITVTVNAIDPEIGARMYEFVTYEGKVLRGKEGASRLIENQLLGIRKAVEAGMLVKVNTVMVPGINAEHIPAVARKVKALGAYIVNIIPLIPVPGTKFADLRAPTPGERKALQDMCEPEIRQMRHCRFCRADAIGLLGEDRSAEFAGVTCGLEPPREEAMVVQMEGKTKHRVAVATSDGEEVDLHFGHAEEFWTYEVEGRRIKERERIRIDAKMDIPVFGGGHRAKIEKAAEALSGFDIVIASKFGNKAVEVLRSKGLEAVQESGEVGKAIVRAVDKVFKQRAETFE